MTTLEAGSTSTRRPYIATATTALHRLRLLDVGLVVAAQVGDLPLVEQHDARERRQARLGEDAGRLPRARVVLEGEERGELGLGPRRELERRLGADAERALVAGEQLLEVERGRGLAQLAPAAVADLGDLAGRQHDLHRDDVLARVAEARAEQRPAAGADPPADQRARVRRRVVGIEDAVPLELLVELEHVDARPDGDRAVHEVDLVDLVHQLDVDEDPAAQRDGAVGQPGAAGARHDRDAAAGWRA